MKPDQTTFHFPAAPERLMFFSGPLGSMLHTGDKPPESLLFSLEGRTKLMELYHEYSSIGLDVISSCTFAANRYILKRYGWENQVEFFNTEAVKLAREAADGKRLVAGSIGPLDLAGALGDDEIKAIYLEQITALTDGGVDFLFFETFSSCRESENALRAAAQFPLPKLFSINGSRFGRKNSWPLALKLLKAAEACGADAFGINCAAPSLITELLHHIREELTLPIFILPNAGTPTASRGQISYHLADISLLQEAEKWVQLGVSGIGGCCGITPTQMRLLHDRFSQNPIQPCQISVTSSIPAKKTVPVEIPANLLREKIKNNQIRIAVELRNPIDSRFDDWATLAAQFQADSRVCFTIPDCPTGNLNLDPLATAALLRRHTNAEIILHQSASNANLLKLYALLLGAWELDVHGILALSGDPPSLGAFSRLATRVCDTGNSGEMLKLLSKLEQGELLNDQTLKKARPFFRACAFNPAPNLAGSLDWLKQKIDHGAEALFTQPVFSTDEFESLEKSLTTCDSSIIKFFGVMPLNSAAQARRLNGGLIPGILVPENTVKALEQFSPEEQENAALHQATDLALAILQAGHRLYLIPPFSKKRADVTREIIRVASESPFFAQ